MKSKRAEYLIGIDEAGLGPVFGPLVVAGVVIKSENLFELKQLGIKDSKLFGSSKQSRIKRKTIWEKAAVFVENYQYKIISAEKLDKNNMYDLEVEAMGKILTNLNWEAAEAILIDQLGQTSKEKFLEKLKKYGRLPNSETLGQKLIYEKKADTKYIPTSLASIIAKVVRDDEVEKLCQKIGESYISSYPNKKTEEFLVNYFQKHHSLPQGTRRSRDWPPLRKLIFKESKSRK